MPTGEIAEIEGTVVKCCSVCVCGGCCCCACDTAIDAGVESPAVTVVQMIIGQENPTEERRAAF